jgi:hypothetical protein
MVLLKRLQTDLEDLVVEVSGVPDQMEHRHCPYQVSPGEHVDEERAHMLNALG